VGGFPLACRACWRSCAEGAGGEGGSSLQHRPGLLVRGTGHRPAGVRWLSLGLGGFGCCGGQGGSPGCSAVAVGSWRGSGGAGARCSQVESTAVRVSRARNRGRRPAPLGIRRMGAQGVGAGVGVPRRCALPDALTAREVLTSAQ